MRRARGALAAVLLALLGAPDAGATDDPAWGRQWAPNKIGAPSAWARSTGRGVRVAIVDTGADLAHEDLASRIVVHADCRGSSGVASRCRTDGAAGQDDHGHGTHIAGIIAAVRDNKRGVAGIAPDASLVVVKTLDADGTGAAADLTGGVRFALDQGARVVNLSLEGDVGPSAAAALRDAVELAWSRGAIAVVASGNTDGTALASGTSDLPALVVAATGPDDEVPSWSHPTGDAKWALVAPGGNGRGPDGRPSCSGDAGLRCIASTYWRAGRTNVYADDEGTSMAAGHVSAVAALLLATGLSPQATVDRILATAKKVPCGPGSPTCVGRLDAGAALGGPAPGTTTTSRPRATTTSRTASSAATTSTSAVAAATTTVPFIETTSTTEALATSSSVTPSPRPTIALGVEAEPSASSHPLTALAVLLLAASAVGTALAGPRVLR